MYYDHIVKGRFIARPNRFIAQVEIRGKTEVCHVKNTGRCKELLVPGAEVYLQRAGNPERKTKYDIVTVRKGERLINMDSQIPNKVLKEWLVKTGYFQGMNLIRPETSYGKSRFDFYLEADGRRIFAEVKGVTLEEKGVVLFPDAPTERGIKHINELVECRREGYEAYLFFVIQMEDVRYFMPNDKMHAEFGEALRNAVRQGVQVVALDCSVTEDSIVGGREVEVVL